MIRLRILRWGDCPGIHGWVLCDHKGSYRKGNRGTRGREGDGMTEADVCERDERVN